MKGDKKKFSDLRIKKEEVKTSVKIEEISNENDKVYWKKTFDLGKFNLFIMKNF